jgi:hypothetical protein
MPGKGNVMGKMIRICLFVGLAVLFSGTYSFAGYSYDYSDAPGYGVARHTTGEWQKLGSAWNSETSALTPDLDTSDDGVWWSTDGGSNYGHAGVTAGQTVMFRVDMWSAGYGNHPYDQVKVWLDLDQNGVWDNTAEQIIADQFSKPANMIVNDNVPNFNPSLYSGVTNSYYSSLITIPDTLIGELWLRARVSCDHVSFDNTTPYGELWQGEVEDWKISVNPVPEPASMILVGIGLIGIAGYGRKKFKK